MITNPTDHDAMGRMIDTLHNMERYLDGCRKKGLSDEDIALTTRFGELSLAAQVAENEWCGHTPLPEVYLNLGLATSDYVDVNFA
ncbi:MAG: hypothetical protein AAB459_03000 [Patescibacteria group bacterium]